MLLWSFTFYGSLRSTLARNKTETLSPAWDGKSLRIDYRGLLVDVSDGALNFGYEISVLKGIETLGGGEPPKAYGPYVYINKYRRLHTKKVSRPNLFFP